MRAATFVEQMVTHLPLLQLWGGSFSLGYRREGDFDYLQAAGETHGFSVHKFGAVTNDSKRISSTEIRQHLRNAEVTDATRLLGRPYSMTGKIVYGRQLGRTIGIPTANLGVWERQLLPANGVYATRIHLAESSYIAATNIGVRPTVDGDTHTTVEAHILDFDADIYGECARLEFIDYIRPEQKFSGLDALKAQISADVEQVRSLLQTE